MRLKYLLIGALLCSSTSFAVLELQFRKLPTLDSHVFQFGYFENEQAYWTFSERSNSTYLDIYEQENLSVIRRAAIQDCNAGYKGQVQIGDYILFDCVGDELRIFDPRKMTFVNSFQKKFLNVKGDTTDFLNFFIDGDNFYYRIHQDDATTCFIDRFEKSNFSFQTTTRCPQSKMSHFFIMSPTIDVVDTPDREQQSHSDGGVLFTMISMSMSSDPKEIPSYDYFIVNPKNDLVSSIYSVGGEISDDFITPAINTVYNSISYASKSKLGINLSTLHIIKNDQGISWIEPSQKCSSYAIGKKYVLFECDKNYLYSLEYSQPVKVLEGKLVYLSKNFFCIINRQSSSHCLSSDDLEPHPIFSNLQTTKELQNTLPYDSNLIIEYSQEHGNYSVFDFTSEKLLFNFMKLNNAGNYNLAFRHTVFFKSREGIFVASY